MVTVDLKEAKEAIRNLMLNRVAYCACGSDVRGSQTLLRKPSNLALDLLGFVLEQDEVNDGTVSVSSARFLGGIMCDHLV